MAGSTSSSPAGVDRPGDGRPQSASMSSLASATDHQSPPSSPPPPSSTFSASGSIIDAPVGWVWEGRRESGETGDGPAGAAAAAKLAVDDKTPLVSASSMPSPQPPPTASSAQPASSSLRSNVTILVKPGKSTTRNDREDGSCSSSPAKSNTSDAVPLSAVGGGGGTCTERIEISCSAARTSSTGTHSAP